jgi:hypothetical protein
LDFPTLEDGFTFGVGINTGYIRDELVAETKIDERYHPMLPGSGISRYGTANTKGWIMFDRDYVKGRGKLGRSLPAEHFFSSKKILIVRTRNFSLSRRVIATIDENQFYNLNRLSNIIAKPGFNLFGLLGILNSQLYNWLFSTRYFDYEIKPIYLKECPLADTNSPDLLALVKKIIYFNQHEHLSTDSIQKEIKSVDHSIDTLVYELYGLTEEEIAIVEGREVDSSAQPIAKPAKKKVKAPVAPVKAVEEKKAAPAKKQVAASDYGLYKCSECGNKVMGFTKDEHVSQVHGEQAVDWVKMGGG